MRRKILLAVIVAIAVLATGSVVGALNAPEETHVQAARDACERLDRPPRSSIVRREARLCVAELDAVLAPDRTTTTTIDSTPGSSTPGSTTPGSSVPLGTCPTTDTRSTYSGTRLTYAEAARYGYEAGFTSENDLVTMVSIGMAESSLDVGARNWHTEYGCRPRTDVIGVVGPDSVWDSTHARQLHSDRGPWQISSHWWPEFTDEETDDPATAAEAFRAIYLMGRGFVEWDTYNSGAASRYYAAARPAVQALLATV
ncbi:MAG TPA: hypothetical protein VNC41_03430 [Acidimicrobiia bacterium]|nr:hypothetical protein [Acidimicrobiia bacterium]